MIIFNKKYGKKRVLKLAIKVVSTNSRLERGAYPTYEAALVINENTRIHSLFGCYTLRQDHRLFCVVS